MPTGAETNCMRPTRHMNPQSPSPRHRQDVLFSDTDSIRTDTYSSDVPAVAETPTAAAPADWRARERLRQSTAHELHRAAAIDLASADSLWGELPTDGPVDDLLTVRHASEVPSIHLSRA